MLIETPQIEESIGLGYLVGTKVSRHRVKVFAKALAPGRAREAASTVPSSSVTSLPIGSGMLLGGARLSSRPQSDTRVTLKARCGVLA